MKELQELNKTPIPGVEIRPDDNDVTKWDVVFNGPEGTPFVGGKFIVAFDFSNGYPFKPPGIHFKTKIYHPNVKTDTGEICTQAIESAWVPTLNAKYVIEAVLTVISTPTVENAQEVAIAQQYQSNKSAYETTAAQWTAQYAHDN